MMRLSRQPNRYHGKQYIRKPRYHYPQPLTFYLDMGPLPARGYRQTRIQRSMNSKFQDDILKLHNRYRARHCARPLTLSQRLSQIAQSHAEYLAATSKYEYSGHTLEDEPLGENLFLEWANEGPAKASAKAIVKYWYGEIAQYDFDNPRFLQETAHFTQMVWKSSRKLGVGVAYSPDRSEVYVVTNYYPAGNIEDPGFFEENVSPPTC
ncbi:unnamed protein product [Rotaria sp. Silwood1]|nr:unnamed protein product [Rotaria sp. Silwood1]